VQLGNLLARVQILAAQQTRIRDIDQLVVDFVKNLDTS
jgi:hypothetical protein